MGEPNAINRGEYEMITGVADQNIEAAFNSLRELFKQRQLWAQNIRQQGPHHQQQLLDAVLYANNEIKKALFLG